MDQKNIIWKLRGNSSYTTSSYAEFTVTPFCLFQYAELETILGDVDRARAIFELAIKQPKLDMPEVLWKAYIDFEVEQEEYDNTRNLYRRLLDRTQHVKVSGRLRVCT